MGDDLFAPKQLAWELGVGLVYLSPALMVRRRPRSPLLFVGVVTEFDTQRSPGYAESLAARSMRHGSWPADGAGTPHPTSGATPAHEVDQEGEDPVLGRLHAP